MDRQWEKRLAGFEEVWQRVGAPEMPPPPPMGGRRPAPPPPPPPPNRRRPCCRQRWR